MSIYASTLATLAPLTPPEADAKLDSALVEYARAQQLAEAAKDRRDRAVKRYAESAPEHVAERQREYDRTLERYTEARAVLHAHDANFAAKNGWTRAWIVPNGHVHTSRRCSTCFDTTQFGLVAQFSGMDAAEIVDAAGSRACTICFPTAPITKAPHPDMLHRSEREAAAARAERERRSAEKKAAAAAKAVYGDDGEPLKIWHTYRDGSRSSDTIKTETSAKTRLNDVLYSAVFEAGLVLRPLAHRPVNEDHGRNADDIVRSLARKHGVAVEVESAEALKRLAKKDKDLAANLRRIKNVPGSELDWDAS